MALIVLLLFVALLFLLAMLVLIFSTAASVMGTDRPVNPDDPTCGGCGYIVKNINEPVCSVCHGEFRFVGIVMPTAPANNSAAAAWLAFRRVSGLSLGIWTVIAGAVSLALTVWAGEHFLPYYSESVTHVEVRPRTTGYDSVLMAITHRRRARGRAQQEDPISIAQTVVLDLKMAKGTRRLEADLLAPSLTYTGGTGKTISSVAVPSKEVLLDFMKAGGVTITPQVDLEASAIAKIIADPASLDENSTDHSSNGDLPVEILSNTVDGGSWEAAMPLPFMVIPSAIFLWLVGVGVISFAQRGRRAALREQILSSTTPLHVFWEPAATPPEIVAAAATHASVIPLIAPKEAGPAPAANSSVPAAKTDPAKAA